jgi:hypothetical protein
MEEIGQGYLVIGAGIGLLVVLFLLGLWWGLIQIAAYWDDIEGVRDD